MTSKLDIKIERSNMTNAITIVESLGQVGVKEYEIELQRVIEENVKKNNCKGSWWKYTNKRIFNDLMDINKKDTDFESLVMYITELFDEVYKNIK